MKPSRLLSPRLFLVIGLLLLVAWLALKTWRLVTIGQQLLGYQAQAEQLRSLEPRWPGLAKEWVRSQQIDALLLSSSVVAMKLSDLSILKREAEGRLIHPYGAANSTALNLRLSTSTYGYSLQARCDLTRVNRP